MKQSYPLFESTIPIFSHILDKLLVQVSYVIYAKGSYEVPMQSDPFSLCPILSDLKLSAYSNIRILHPL